MSRTAGDQPARAAVTPPSVLLTRDEAVAQALYAVALESRRSAYLVGTGTFTVLGLFLAILGLLLVGTLTPNGGMVGAASIAVGMGLFARALGEERARGECDRDLARLARG